MKKLIAIAIVAGLSAPAMADTTIYGQLHASVDAFDGEDLTVSSNSSRIGVKGSAQLNGGLKAIYKAEWGIDTGTGTETLGDRKTFKNRNQVVGLAGRRGAVLVGRHDTPLKIIGRKADLFWSTQLGQNRSGGMLNSGEWDLRPNNVIAYQSPKIGGFQMLAARVTSDIANSTTDNDGWSVNGVYKAGPLMLGAAWETHDWNDSDAVRLMAAYKFGRTKLVGFYQDESNSLVNVNDANVLGIGAAYKISPSGTVKGQYYVRDEDGVADEKQLFAIGYDHKLGKKTDVYAQYATTKNTGLGGTGHDETFIENGDASGLSVGIRHKF